MFLLLALLAADFAAVDAFVARSLDEYGIPGVALAIVQDGQVVHARGFGRAGPDGAPVTPDTPFQLGSLSKSFTALAVMQQVEAGRLSLDARVQTYLPWFTSELTLRQLLHHTSGLPATTPDALHGEGVSLDDHVRMIARVTPGPPGSHSYSSLNYLVLGRVLEQVTGEPFGAYVEQHVFAPLGMTASATTAGPALAAGHRLLAGFPFAAALRHESDRLPTASLIASASDLARYLQFHMGTLGVEVLSAAGRAQLHAPAAPADGFAYAMGWRVGATGGVPSLWHGGALPHYRTALAFDPERRWGVVLLSNLGSFNVDHTRAMASWLAAHLAGQPEPAPRPSQRWWFTGICAAIVVVFALTLRKLARVRRWREEVASRLAEPRGRLRVRVGAATEIVWPIAVAVAVPWSMGLPAWAMVEAMPDVTLGAAALLALEMVLGASRLALTLRD